MKLKKADIEKEIKNIYNAPVPDYWNKIENSDVTQIPIVVEKKRRVMPFYRIATLAACFVLVLTFSIIGATNFFSENSNQSNTNGQKNCMDLKNIMDYEKIQFPKIAQESHGEIPFNFELGSKKEIIGKELSLYKVTPRRDEKNAENYDSFLFEVFEVSIDKSVKNEHFTKYFCNDGGTLEIYNSGSFIFSHNRKKQKIVELSDNEIITIAEKFLRDNALLPEGFTVGKVLGGTYNGKGEPLKKTVGFYHEIDGCEVYGRSDIIVEVDSLGINAIYSIYSEYEFEQKIKCLTYDEILDISPLKEGQIVYDSTKLSSAGEYVIFEDVEIMYYDSPVNQPKLTYIQPVYKFIGKIYDIDGHSTDYYWIIQAIS